MSTELAEPIIRKDRYDDHAMVETIKQTVCRGATDAQLRMFIEVCRSTGLNPFLKEIYYVAEKGIIMAARDGYLRVANENLQFDGMETRVERDDKHVPVKAVCTVWRKDRTHPIICEAYFNEYRKAGPVWSQYPSAMISKVAEVLALKRSFAINGVVSEEELGDGTGSAQQAQAVAQAKLSGEMPLKGEPPTEIEQQLAESIKQAEQRKADKPSKKAKEYDKFAMYEAMGEIKKRFEAIGSGKQYYHILNAYGAHKRTDLPTDDDGKTARACYKEMSLVVADLPVVEESKPAELGVSDADVEAIWKGSQ